MTFNEIKQLALKGNVRAKFIYACSLIDGKYEGNICEKNYEEGKKILFELGQEEYTECILAYAEVLRKYESLTYALDYLKEKTNQIPDDELVKCLYGVFLFDAGYEKDGISILKSLDSNPVAWFNLSAIYLKIPYIITNYKNDEVDSESLQEGMKYLQKSLNAEVPGAYYVYGCCYLWGVLGEMDHNKAYQNLYIAASNGFEEAKNLLKHFKKKFLKGWVFDEK